jgi:hypothetical protein
LIVKLSSAAVAGAVAAWTLKLILSPQHPILTAVFVLIPYGLVYLGVTYGWRVPEAQGIVRQIARVVGRSTP